MAATVSRNGASIVYARNLTRCSSSVTGILMASQASESSVGSPADPYNLGLQQGTADLNPAALASLVLAIMGFVALPLVGPVLAIVLGEVAMRQIAHTGQAGLAVAKAGTILGAAWFVLVLGTIVVFSILTAITRLR